jgi:sulfate transport system substrate-binding protein
MSLACEIRGTGASIPGAERPTDPRRQGMATKSGGRAIGRAVFQGAALAALISLGVGCIEELGPAAYDAVELAPAPATAKKTRTLTLGAYTTPQEVYGTGVIPAFQELWRARTGEEVRFEVSYKGSSAQLRAIRDAADAAQRRFRAGAQARAVIGGFDADVAALSLEAHVRKLEAAGLVTRRWDAGPHRGMVSRSVVAIAVRPGNPKGIRDWDDLARPGIELLTPNPETSGGALWNIAALWGAALRGHTAAAAGDAEAAADLLGRVIANVSVMDGGARDSMLRFGTGVGDAIITYENEVLAAQRAGRACDLVLPRSTILIENPVAVVDVYAARHGTTDLADEFVRFLQSPEAQRLFAEGGYRPVDETIAAAFQDRYPIPEDLFAAKDLGGWDEIERTLFAAGGVYERVVSPLREATNRPRNP